MPHLEHRHVERQEELERLLHYRRRRRVAHAALVQSHLLAQLPEHEHIRQLERRRVGALSVHIVNRCLAISMLKI